MIRKIILFLAVFCFCFSVYGYERIVFTGGLSRQDAGGMIELVSDYAVFLGAGYELYNDLYGVIKFTFPSQYSSETYPVFVNINGSKDTLNFHKFTTLDLMAMAHYTLPIFPESKINPKIFTGLGLHWLYNSKVISGEPNIQFNGIGPEFGLGAAYRPNNNLIFDITVSVKFPYYNEYKKQGDTTVPIGIDQQILCLNLALFYLIDIGGDVDDFE